MHLHEANRATDEDALNLAVELFNKHATALGLSHVDEDMFMDLATLLPRLPVLEKMLTQMSCEVLVVEDAPTDDQDVWVTVRSSGHK
ncbi:hypothetical protein SPRG_17714 [Saprolegnia parasitica CBS 223.65]|uniref:Uncharacterized protein n=1 Tax=Saprolegnia parasitica (strain CBS 223.65) TaxID=695850 RepID=A0A067BQ52_SAPPC|nr:hypothetical protein SPRG_17714 [Saprolegnia parasitica CBS 223.65]KDO16797.1 hypothetical protein SPRG_17714 [Saprolegnia parasitica CBS 223.65]|eukprot:XP_012212495.1 hypothetical protein SPRG_17714 [Saprolegnia parasitica CBS 223.65]